MTPDSLSSFPDEGRFLVEIPSSETPEVVSRVITAAKGFGVPVHCISQGSGVLILYDAELDELASVGAEQQGEICPFARPTAS